MGRGEVPKPLLARRALTFTKNMRGKQRQLCLVNLEPCSVLKRSGPTWKGFCSVWWLLGLGFVFPLHGAKSWQPFVPRHPASGCFGGLGHGGNPPLLPGGCLLPFSKVSREAARAWEQTRAVWGRRQWGEPGGSHPHRCDRRRGAGVGQQMVLLAWAVEPPAAGD